MARSVPSVMTVKRAFPDHINVAATPRRRKDSDVLTMIRITEHGITGKMDAERVSINWTV